MSKLTASDYDRIVRWGRSLANETPMYWSEFDADLWVRLSKMAHEAHQIERAEEKSFEARQAMADAADAAAEEDR